MRKKSKKKQIVAMTLALSVLSSSVGMCGASAAKPCLTRMTPACR